ncbi:hypothetical protein CR203_03345 [Salipaludibacillus neizhouensis]|uniref:Zinc-finger domain-containing protein n=1 Tax=Salipaludibacillus neizhouensis TaxID=885475 RepID=A0A3A9KBS9_9BACI|nr:hypothetical protein CR203_03345 [Salipaludibacillus neizhouensis]
MLRDKEKRIEIFKQVDIIVHNHCNGCQNPKRNTAYCNRGCKHGVKLRKFGALLEGESKPGGPKFKNLT